MSEAQDQMSLLRVPSEESSAAAQPLSPSAGQMLQRARLDAGLSLESLSARLKVSVQRLQAFESDQFEQGQNLQLGRAMVASVARYLGLDAQSILQKLPQAMPHVRAAQSHSAKGGFVQETRLTMRRGVASTISAVWWVAALCMLAAAALFFYPHLKQVASDLAPLWLTASSKSVQASPELVARPNSEQPNETPSAVGLAADVQPLLAAQGSSVVANSSTLEAASPVILFKARGNTWVEVTDAKGVVLLRRTLVMSEAAEVNGALPMSVVVGRADHTDVIVKGQTFALEPYIQENVARFKVP